MQEYESAIINIEDFKQGHQSIEKHEVKTDCVYLYSCRVERFSYLHLTTVGSVKYLRINKVSLAFCLLLPDFIKINAKLGRAPVFTFKLC